MASTAELSDNHPSMRIIQTDVHGSVIIESPLYPDERGSFTTTYDRQALEALGLKFAVVEDHLAHNARAGTLRGLHFQQEPSAQAKLVRCVRGRIYDITLDLRHNSPTYLRWAPAELREGDGRALFVPVGCAHGYLTLEDRADVLLLRGRPLRPGARARRPMERPRVRHRLANAARRAGRARRDVSRLPAVTRRRLAAILVALLVVSSPFIGEFRNLLESASPASWTRLSVGLVGLSLAGAFVAAVARIRAGRWCRYGGLALSASLLSAARAPRPRTAL